MAKALGTEIVDFFLNGWPEGYYSDESVLTVMDDGRIVREDDPEGAPGLSVTEKYELEDFGAIVHEKNFDAKDFSYFFNKWRKTKSTATLIIEVPKDQESSIRNRLLVLGLKIIS